MSKSHVQELSRVYEAILKDALYTFPTIGDEIQRDLTRLRRTAEQRGVHFYLVDLPALCKHLDRCLDNGEYVASHLPCSGRVNRTVVIPKLFRGLYLLIFNSSGKLREDYNVEAIFYLRQLLSCAKKVELPCGRDSIRREICEFIQTDSQLPRPEGFWDSDHVTPGLAGETYRGFDKSPVCIPRVAGYSSEQRRELSILLTNLDRISMFVCSALGPFKASEWRLRHGPGAVSERSGAFNKYCWKNWSDRLETEFPIADYGFHNYGSWCAAIADREILNEDPSSRLICVPKSLTKPRLIAAEPSEHQWCQQSIWHYFCERSAHSWISKFITFRDQTRNQQLCVKGSVDGSLATVDLSAASDRVTPHVVGQLFRHNVPLLMALRATRTRSITQDILPELGERIELRKFSTMGSACTFPVESIIFMSIAIAAVLTSRKLPVTLKSITDLSGQVTIFGDDIIIPKDSRELLYSALEVLYFKVNENKSFYTGRFRESCGVDSFAGVDVTPVYWKGCLGSNPESIASTVECSNNFYKKFLVTTSAYLASTTRKLNIPYVGIDSGVFGYKSFVEPKCRNKIRYSGTLHRHEVLVPVLSTEQRRTATDDDSGLLQYFTEAPSPQDKWVHGVPQRPKIKLRRGWIPLYHLFAQRNG